MAAWAARIKSVGERVDAELIGIAAMIVVSELTHVGAVHSVTINFMTLRCNQLRDLPSAPLRY